MTILTLDKVHEDVEGGHVVPVGLVIALGGLGLAGPLPVLSHLLAVRR